MNPLLRPNFTVCKKSKVKQGLLERDKIDVLLFIVQFCFHFFLRLPPWEDTTTMYLAQKMYLHKDWMASQLPAVLALGFHQAQLHLHDQALQFMWMQKAIWIQAIG